MSEASMERYFNQKMDLEHKKKKDYNIKIIAKIVDIVWKILL